MEILILYGANDQYGASRVLLEEIVALKSLGHNITLMVPFDGPLEELLTSFDSPARIVIDPGLRVLRRSKITDLFHQSKVLRGMARNADVIYLWTLAMVPHLFLLFRFKEKLLILSIHEFFPKVKSWKMLRIFNIFNRLQFQTFSETVSGWLLSLGISEHKINRSSIIFNCDKSKVNVYSRKRFMVTKLSKPLRVGIIGRLNGKKGQHELVNYIRENQWTRNLLSFHFFGSSFRDELMTKNFLSQIEREPHIKYHGEFLNFDTIASSVDIILHLPLIPESLGLVPFNGLENGLRTIGSNNGGGKQVMNLTDGIVVNSIDEFFALIRIEDQSQILHYLYADWRPNWDKLESLNLKCRKLSVQRLLQKSLKSF
jgi:glycosyltransferase involved in cell wall biosynthesis